MILRQTLYGLISLLVVAPFALGLDGRTVLHRFFALLPIAGIGLISYGVYLWHELLFAGEFSFRVMPWELFDGNFMGRLIVTTAATLVIAAANYRFLEEPLARRFSK
jgi:peptidoglycan/LPS O-acetylase OafA/YrhL